ncbi:SDR family NAD(P)-dependent oxidoreductase [Chitinimonas koreensis]|uniref:SDR family NAD(P)-dependent oxidoreductase n=1 Tax=Chitinimonas koreensis TaxID=356302 RepID=UPI0004062E59|nr:SDR family NAD(P)-dependent oxidoreductase [Chitinimonas koreensis]QNM95834.1 SDR family NAD(P)-dependent oxidoreductase [Chitinimonas koreensis]
MQLKDSVFLVSGGASGLGAAVARMAVAAGGRVVIADRNADAGEALAAELGANAAFARADVTDEAACRAAVALAGERFGRLDALVNCAGVVHGEKVVGKEAAHLLDSFKRVIDVNLVGSFNLLRLAAEAMSKQAPHPTGERGVVINTASVAAFDGQIGQCAYSASKAGIVGMTLPAARELARFGIRVMTIAPGIFKTPMMAGLPQEVQDSLGASIPFPSRMGEPAEYADLVAAIVGNPMLNGEVIRLDGALRMAPK